MLPMEHTLDYTQLVESYLKGDTFLKPLPPGFSCYPLLTNKLNLIVKVIKDNWSQLSFDAKLQRIHGIRLAFYHMKATQNQSIQANIVSLKKALGDGVHSNKWQDSLLGIQGTVLQDINHPAISYHPDATLGYQQPFFKQNYPPSFTLFGSTFKTNKARILQAFHPAKTRSLDAAYVHQIALQEFSFAIADGAGGHFGDEKQDNLIAKVAHVAVKQAVRLLNALKNPEEFDTQHLKLVEQLAASIKLKVSTEGATLVAGRIFKQGKQLLCKGFNIGDSMCIVWCPSTQALIHLAPATLDVSAFTGQEATANFPTSYKPEQIHPFSALLPEDAVVLLMTDGMYESLPCQQTLHPFKDGGQYKQVYLDTAYLKSLFEAIPIQAEAGVYADTLHQAALKRMDALRQTKLQLSQDAKLKLPEMEQQVKQKELTIDPNDKAAMQAHRASLDTLHQDIDIQIGDDMALLVLTLSANHPTVNLSAASAATVLTELTPLTSAYGPQTVCRP